MPITLPATPITWLFTGDSITHGCLHTGTERSYVELVNEVIRRERGRLTDVLINTAVSGARTSDLLDAFEFYAGRFDADVVLVMYGTNDAKDGLDGLETYERNLREIVERFERSGAQVVLQVPPTIRAIPAGREHIAHYRDVVRKLAAEKGLVLVDHDAAWPEDFDHLQADDFHPNAAGHALMADTLVRALGI